MTLIQAVSLTGMICSGILMLICLNMWDRQHRVSMTEEERRREDDEAERW